MDRIKLTLLQYAASRFLIINYNQNRDGMIVAVCGAGKTEMCFPIFNMLISSQKIAFCIPRIDICDDIYQRLCDYYGKNLIGIHTGVKQINLNANLLVLTTNQMAKYKNYFTLTIVDEVDAFPFETDPRFYAFIKNATLHSTFYLTSTPSEQMLELKLPTFTIYKRWHNLPLPVPKMIHTNKKFINYRILNLLRNPQRQILIFVPTIKCAKNFSTFLSTKKIKHKTIYSSHPKRAKIIEQYRKNEFTILVTTTILERGVTFKDIDVIVINSDDNFYTKASLVQIAGRARRDINYQSGQVFFCYQFYTKTIKDAIHFIKENNNRI